MSSLVLPDPDLQPIDWKTINKALTDWITDSVPAVEERVRWENQDISQPRRIDFPYITMLRTSVVDDGGIAETRTRTLDADGDIVTDTNGLIPFRNEELSYEPVLINLAVSAHVNSKSGVNDPSCDAIALLSRAQRSLDLTSVCLKLGDSGLSPVDDGSIVDTSVVINGKWQSKATLDVVFRTASVLSSGTTPLSFIDDIQLVPVGFPIDPVVD